MGRERVDASSILEKPYEPKPFALIEVGGTIYHGCFENIDAAGDVLRAWGMDYPRPGTAKSFGYFEFENILSSGWEGEVTRVVLRTIKMAGRMADTGDFGYQGYVDEWEEDKSYLLDRTRNFSQRALINQAYKVMIPSYRKLKEGDEFFRSIAPNQRRIRILEGGIFNTLTLVKMAQRRGIIDGGRARLLNEGLIQASPKEDIIFCFLLHPRAIYNQNVFIRYPELLEEFGMTFRSARDDHKASLEFNEAAMEVVNQYVEELPPLRIVDLRRQSASITDEVGLAKLYCQNLLKSLCQEVLPEFSSHLEQPSS